MTLHIFLESSWPQGGFRLSFGSRATPVWASSPPGGSKRSEHSLKV